MVSTLFRDPQALSSALATLGTLQPRAFGSLNRVETLDSASNYYIGFSIVTVRYITFVVLIILYMLYIGHTVNKHCCYSNS